MTLGDNVTVASGAVVIRSFSGKCLIGGVPARVIKKFNAEKAKECFCLGKAKTVTGGNPATRSCSVSILSTAIGSYPARVSKPDISRRSESEASTMSTLFMLF